jgi:hypothetical protein
MTIWEKIKNFCFDKKEDAYSDYEKYEEVEDTSPIKDDWKDFIIGHSIVDVIPWGADSTELTLVLDNGVKLIAKSNEGCGGCDNGWFFYDYENVLSLGLKGNVITNLKVNCDVCGDKGTYTIMIYTVDKRMDVAFEGEDNGYYGMGISLGIIIPIETISNMM